MAYDNQGTAKKHITTACTCCRRRKVKCDGEIPTCSNCRLYKQVCEYNFGEDKRKLSPKKQIESLSQRVKLLEDLLRSNGIEIPQEGNDACLSDGVVGSSFSSEASREQTSSQEIAQKELDHSRSSAVFNRTEPASVPTNIQSRQDNFWGGANGVEINEQNYSQTELNKSISQQGGPRAEMHSYQGMINPEFGVISDLAWSNNGTTAHQVSYPQESGTNVDEDNLRYSPGEDIFSSTPSYMLPDLERHPLPRRDDATKFNTRESPKPKFIELQQSDDIVDQLSARMGSFQIAEDGQLRYFGATSNLHIVHNGESSLSRIPTRSVYREGSLALQRAGLGQDVSEELEEHLEKLYFTWEDPAIHVVDMEMYYIEKAKYNNGELGTPFYSETLKNAICAIGANLTSRSCPGLPDPVPEFFSSRAKALLDIEMDSPTVATVQALVIMSASEAAFTRDARGWIYSGMAVRISADLGLHLDLSSYVQDGRLTAQELDVRRTTFWGVFVHENMWSLYVGRPWGIDIHDISISRPSEAFERSNNQLWRAYSDESTSSENRPQAYHDPIEAFTDSNISLCAMMRRLSRTLYAGRELSDDDLRKFASDMRTEFSNWHKNLHQGLAVDISQEDKIHLPHVLQLHIQFYAISIFLHRPFFSRNSRSQQVSIQAQRACTEAAQTMVKLLRIYRKQHTLRRCNVQLVHLLFTSSLIHIYNTCRSQGRAAELAMLDLQFSCQALGEIGVAYKNATRALEVIICIKREWQRTTNAVKLKRPIPPTVSDNGDLPNSPEQRKRRATGEKAVREDVASMLRATAYDASREQEQEQDDMWQFLDQPILNFGDGGQLGSGFPVLAGFPDGSFGYPALYAGLPNIHSGGNK